MEFRVLGPLEVADGAQTIEIAGSKRRAVLALLVLRANEVVRTERLIDELWGDNPPANAAAALHNHVSRLRKAIGPEILIRREWGYVLRADRDAIDLHRFERKLVEADPYPAHERSKRLAEALTLWRGAPLSDLALEPALRTDIARLDELYIGTLERRIDADLEAGRSSELIGELETLISAHPLREHLRSQLILAFYRAGRQAEALEVYRETRRVLDEELGLEPSPELRELEKAILRQDPSLVASPGVPPVPGLASIPPPLPPASRRRRWLIGGVAGILLLGSGLAAAAALIVATNNGADQPAAARSIVLTNTVHYATTLPGQTVSIVRHIHRIRRVRRHTRRTVPLTPPTTTVVDTVKTSPTTTAAAPPATPNTTSNTPSTRTHTPSTRTTSRRTSPRTTTRPPAKPSTTTTTPAVPPATASTISDAFSGNQIDGTIWYQIYQGSGWSMGEHDGHLEFSFPPTSTPGGQYNVFGGHVGTLCNFSGDFDARVDFNLVSWPAANGLTVTLWAFLGPENTGYQSWRASHTNDAGGEQYGSYTGTSVGVSLNDLSGTLRIARKRGLITAYFLHNQHWQSLTSGLDNENAKIAVGVQSAPAASLSGQTVTVDFTNFTVTGTETVCPPGATPPTG